VRLKLDLRPPSRESIVDAELEQDETVAIDDAIETADWAPITPGKPSKEPVLSFVDGVQQVHARVFAENEARVWPTPGIVTSCAAAAVSPWSQEPFRFLRVERRVILANAEQPPQVTISSHSGDFEFAPLAAAGDDPAALDHKLNQLRADIELMVVHDAMAALPGIIVVDGRLPPVVSSAVVGLIKTPHRIELAKEVHARTLSGLCAGQRTPIYKVERSQRTYYRWFVCLRTPGAYDLAQQGLAILEMDDAASLAEARHMADCTAQALTRYASSPARDARAPQNLLPVGRLEDWLRRRLGDSELIRRRLAEAFRKAAA
jgi:hypothetical protein